MRFEKIAGLRANERSFTLVCARDVLIRFLAKGTASDRPCPWEYGKTLEQRRRWTMVGLAQHAMGESGTRSSVAAGASSICAAALDLRPRPTSF
jgi:hypothetical protein